MVNAKFQNFYSGLIPVRLSQAYQSVLGVYDSIPHFPDVSHHILFEGSIERAIEALKELDIEFFKTFNTHYEGDLFERDVKETYSLLQRFGDSGGRNGTTRQELEILLWNLLSIETAVDYENWVSYGRIKVETGKKIFGEAGYSMMIKQESIKRNSHSTVKKKKNGFSKVKRKKVRKR